MGRLDDGYYTLPDDFHIKSLEEMNSLNYSQYEGMITYFKDDGDIPNPMKTVDDLYKVHEKAPVYYGRGGEKYGASAHLTKEARESNVIDNEAKAVVKETSSSSESSYGSLGGINADYLSSLLDEDYQDDEFDDIEEEAEVFLVDDFEEEAVKSTPASSNNTYVSSRLQAIKNNAATINNVDSSNAYANTTTSNVYANTTTSNVYADTTTSNAYANTTTSNAYADTSTSDGYSNQQTNKPYVMSRMEAAKNASNNISFDDFEPYTVSATSQSVINAKAASRGEKTVSNLISYIIAFVVACGLAIFILKFVAFPTEVDGTSMCDTINNGERFLVEKVSYRFNDPKRYDIVVFEGPDGSDYVKRIIGLPGEVVTVSEGYIYINGQMLSDDIYGKECIDKSNYGRLKAGVILDDNEYFVLGDNRNDSVDSRTDMINDLYKNQFKGRLFLKLWPIETVK
ncbi:MAG: signal peptidase I [Lachnospiraceae bacterium]|nr:signal peptidase I [Lachnospiraceae bacterium]